MSSSKSGSKFFWKVFGTAVVLVVALGAIQGLSDQHSTRAQLGGAIAVIVIIGGLSLVAAIIAQIWEA
jgi:uncharacterized membrane protein YhaH (DUF805 family)